MRPPTLAGSRTEWPHVTAATQVTSLRATLAQSLGIGEEEIHMYLPEQPSRKEVGSDCYGHVGYSEHYFNLAVEVVEKSFVPVTTPGSRPPIYPKTWDEADQSGLTHLDARCGYMLHQVQAPQLCEAKHLQIQIHRAHQRRPLTTFGRSKQPSIRALMHR